MIQIVDRSTEYSQCFGVILKQGEKVISRPMYPYVSEEKYLGVLNDFIENYYDEIVSHNLTAGLSFGNHILGFDTEAKRVFRDRWYKKGVLVY